MSSLRICLLVSLLAGLLPILANGAEEPTAPKARLAVLLVVDQLRGDYLLKWQELFGEGGFRRLCRDGTWFQDCQYPYAATATGPGHASMTTGCSPHRHGIVGNEWYDVTLGELVYCATLPRYEQVPPVLVKENKKKPAAGGSPERLLVPSLGDALKEATGGKGKVVSLSLKDRSAVLPGGRRPDACYWFDSTSGNFVTSTYYRDRVHPWVEAFNTSRLVDSWFGKDWVRLRPDLDYVRHSGPDDVPGEGKGSGQGVTFPHPTVGSKNALGKEYYEAVYTSPFGNDLLLALVKRAIEEEHLGADDVPDLLCVSFSSNDPVGHAWGPDSQEVLDMTLRTDQQLQDFLSYLDKQVGPGRYVVVLTADHGICPLPELSKAQGRDAGRLNAAQLLREAQDHLARTFSPQDPKARWIDMHEGSWLYLNRRLLAERGLSSASVEKELAAWLQTQPGIAVVCTRTQLLEGRGMDDPLRRRVRQSFHPERCGDLAVITKPHWLASKYTTGTSHGTPYFYDVHVPLLVFGPGFRGGPSREAVTPLAAAAILAQGLGIPPPAAAEVPLPTTLRQ